MSNRVRMILLAGAVVVAVVVFVVVRPGSNSSAETRSGTQTIRIQVKNGKVVGGLAHPKVKQGDRVRLIVRADVSDEVHLHGYDIEKGVAPGKPARFAFTADKEGAFEIESHKPVEQKIATIQVRPG